MYQKLEEYLNDRIEELVEASKGRTEKEYIEFNSAFRELNLISDFIIQNKMIDFQ